MDLEQHFHIDTTALLWIALLGGVVWFVARRLRRRDRLSYLRYSDLSSFEGTYASFSEHFSGLPRTLKVVALCFLLVAFIDPHWLVEVPSDGTRLDDNELIDRGDAGSELLSVPTRGIAAYLVLDQSGSMEEEVIVQSVDGRRSRMTRLAVLKQTTREFIQGNPRLGLSGRSSDMLGLVGFARVAQVQVPLTLDHDTLLMRLSELQTVKRREQDGTAIGYAIAKTANLIVATRHFAEDLKAEGAPSYDIESTVIILVTDGLQTTHPDDRGHPLRTISVTEAARYAMDNGIRLYIVNVEPALAHFRFNAQRSQLEEAAEMTGGKFYLLDQGHSLLSIYQEIDQLERSVLPDEVLVEGEVHEKESDAASEKEYSREPYAPFFLSVALFLLAIAIGLETTVLRRAP